MNFWFGPVTSASLVSRLFSVWQFYGDGVSQSYRESAASLSDLPAPASPLPLYSLESLHRARSSTGSDHKSADVRLCVRNTLGGRNWGRRLTHRLLFGNFRKLYLSIVVRLLPGSHLVKSSLFSSLSLRPRPVLPPIQHTGKGHVSLSIIASSTPENVSIRYASRVDP